MQYTMTLQQPLDSVIESDGQVKYTAPLTVIKSYMHHVFLLYAKFVGGCHSAIQQLYLKLT